MFTMKSIGRTLAVTLAFVILLTFVPALLPPRVASAFGAMPIALGIFALKTVWTVALRYVGARLALLHEREASR